MNGGGLKRCYGDCGTVFSVNLATGTEAVLHSFCSETHCKDGDLPNGDLTDVNGTLYGTTATGGRNCRDCGTLFAITP